MARKEESQLRGGTVAKLLLARVGWLLKHMREQGLRVGCVDMRRKEVTSRSNPNRKRRNATAGKRNDTQKEKGTIFVEVPAGEMLALSERVPGGDRGEGGSIKLR